jgi:hypothetical protein
MERLSVNAESVGEDRLTLKEATMAPSPMAAMLQTALKDFRKALVARNVSDDPHQKLDRACLGADDFVKFLTEGPQALAPRPPRK